ncbi:MAG: ABC transporter permease [Propionibacteriaceae bacterium]|nr:ABC transporter permease [Propionibacteriaceae bacterium]
MSTWRKAARQAWTELRISFASGEPLTALLVPVIVLVIAWYLRDQAITASVLTVGQFILPGMVGAMVFFGGFAQVAGEIFSDRDDGTLLRMKCLPGGLRGYLAGKTLVVMAFNLILIAAYLIPATALFSGVGPNGPAAWLLLLGVTALGLAATIPWGAILACLVKTPIGLTLPFLLTYGLVAISGIFFPVTMLPSWLQAVVQTTPVYWLGLGMRAALLPDAASAVEIAGSWRIAETLAVLGVWTLVGLAIAPVLLRRMIRGESGARLTATRERLLTRGY